MPPPQNLVIFRFGRGGFWIFLGGGVFPPVMAAMIDIYSTWSSLETPEI
jgi:hypothetical protein